jgi:hypothetical protein
MAKSEIRGMGFAKGSTHPAAACPRLCADAQRRPLLAQKGDHRQRADAAGLRIDRRNVLDRHRETGRVGIRSSGIRDAAIKRRDEVASDRAESDYRNPCLARRQRHRMPLPMFLLLVWTPASINTGAPATCIEATINRDHGRIAVAIRSERAHRDFSISRENPCKI